MRIHIQTTLCHIHLELSSSRLCLETSCTRYEDLPKVLRLIHTVDQIFCVTGFLSRYQQRYSQSCQLVRWIFPVATGQVFDPIRQGTQDRNYPEPDSDRVILQSYTKPEIVRMDNKTKVRHQKNMYKKKTQLGMESTKVIRNQTEIS